MRTGPSLEPAPTGRPPARHREGSDHERDERNRFGPQAPLRGDVLVGHLMTSEVVTIEADESLAVAREVMDLGGFDQLPAIDRRGRVVGLVRRGGLRRALAAQQDAFSAAENSWFGNGRVAAATPITEILERNVPCVEPDVPASVAVDLLRQDRGAQTCVLVFEQGALVGIVTRSDLSRLGSVVVDHRAVVACRSRSRRD